MKPRSSALLSFPLAAAISALLALPSVQAASETWDGGGADANWSNADNWVGNIAAPGSTSVTTNTDVATFDAAIANTWGLTGSPLLIDSATQNLGGISFTLAADNYFIGTTAGNAVRLTSGGTIQILSALTATNAIETINAPLVIQAAAGTHTFANNSANGAGAGAGTLNFAGGITGGATGATVLNLNGTNTNLNTVSGGIANGTATTLAVTKSGAGTWVLSGANTYTGNTTVSAGTLQIDGSRAVAGGGTSSGLLVGAGAGTNGTAIIGSGAGTVTFNGNGYGNAPAVGISGGTGAMTINGGIVNLAGTTGTASASLHIGVSVAVGAATGTVTVNGGQLNVGQRVLLAANNSANNGTLTIAGGVVNIGYNGPLGYTGNNPGNLQFGAGTGTVNLNSGSLRLFAFKSSTGAARINFDGGTLVALGSPTFFLGNNGAADTAPSAAGTYTARVRSGGAIIDTNSFNITIPIVLANEPASPGGALTKQSAGTLTLSGANTYTGGTSVNGGILLVSGGGTLGTGATTVSGSGSILNLDRNDTWGIHAASVQALTIQSGGLVTNGTLTTRGFNTVQTLALDGGELRVTGTARALADGALFKFEAYAIRDTVTVTGSAASSITNPTAIANAGINIGGFTDLGGGVGSALTFNVADVTSSSAADLTVSAVLKNNYTAGSFANLSNGLVKTGAGTLELSAINRYTGNTTVTDGTLVLADNAQLRFVLGATSGTNNSLTGAGTVTLNGDFFIDTTAADALASGTWTLENVPTLSGAYGSTFSVVGFTATGDKWTKDNGLTKRYTFDEETGILTLGPIPAGGYSTWAVTNAPSTTSGQDQDGDGVINSVEYVLGGTITTNDLDKLPEISTTPGGDMLFSFDRDQDSIDGTTTVTIEVGTTLVTWPDSYSVPGPAQAIVPGVTVEKDTSLGFDTITLNIPQAPDTAKFARLKVVVTP